MNKKLNKYINNVSTIKELNKLRENIIKDNNNNNKKLIITTEELCSAYDNEINKNITKYNHQQLRLFNKILKISFLLIIIILSIFSVIKLYVNLLSIRCLIPNNYLIWEATRPISTCEYCKNIVKPTILLNLTREEFMPYAYTSQPIIIKQSISHWPAVKHLNYQFIRDIYSKNPDILNHFKDECQFLHFKSDFLTLNDVFEMSAERAFSGNRPWYIGFSNCNPIILNAIRTLYPKPHFLPNDAEIPNVDYIFLGYEQGAIMHLDYITRLMWQAQLKGTKQWKLMPVPECEDRCSSLQFMVEPGDIILLDTRVWYHATNIKKGEFSLTIQSEYG